MRQKKFTEPATCPKCGQEAVLKGTSKGKHYYQCETCGLKGSSSDDPVWAKFSFTRAVTEAQKAVICPKCGYEATLVYAPLTGANSQEAPEAKAFHYECTHCGLKGQPHPALGWAKRRFLQALVVEERAKRPPRKTKPSLKAIKKWRKANRQRIFLSLPIPLVAEFKELAISKGLSMSSILKDAIENFIKSCK